MVLQSHPLLLSGTRKYGRYESFERIDDRSSGHASIGSRNIGKINIDCQLLFKKSQWGVLGDMRSPAGIMFLNLNFGPPQGCRVKSATITITLDEEDSCLESYRSGRIFHESGCPVQMTEWFGPRGLAGQSKTSEVSRTTRLTPEVHVLGSGGGGLGIDSRKAFTHSARWSFNGQLLPGRGKNSWAYKSLRWDLDENELESQSFHSNKVRTAFTFQHSGQPFLLKVDIDGRLAKRNDRMKSKFKFGTSSKKEGKVVTLVDFQDYSRFQQRLDLVAQGIPRAMEMQNFEDIPVEVLDSVPGTLFQPAQASPDLEHPSQPENSGLEVSTPLQHLPQPGAPALLTAGNPLLSHEATMSARAQALLEAQEFIQALHELERPETYQLFPGLVPNLLTNSSALDSGENDPIEETVEATNPQAAERDAAVAIASWMDEETVAGLLKSPLIIMILHLLASIIKYFGRRRLQLQEISRDASDLAPADRHHNQSQIST